MTPSLLALVSVSSPATDSTPGPDELAASVAVLDYLEAGTAQTAITLTWGSTGYEATGATGSTRTARCISTDDERYAGLLAALDASFGIETVAGTLQFEASEAHGRKGRATFKASAEPAAPTAVATPLCLVLEAKVPVAVTAVQFESTGEQVAHYTATVFPVGPRS